MTEMELRIKSMIAAELRLDEEQLTGDLTLEDLGFDSLTSAEVLMAIEKRLGRAIGSARLMESFNEDTSIDEMIAVVAATAQASKAAADVSGTT